MMLFALNRRSLRVIQISELNALASG